MKIILASTSSRRKELLTQMGIEFEVKAPEIEEDMSQKVNFKKLSEILSKQKCEDVFNRTKGNRLVIGSDCMVYINKHLLGKPHSREDAINMLTMLSGKWHKVVSGLCVMVQDKNGTREYLCHDVTKVKFKKLSTLDIERYIDAGEYIDKAGSYAIQGGAGMFVEKIVGNLSTVIMVNCWGLMVTLSIARWHLLKNI